MSPAVTVLVDGAAVWSLHATHGFPLDLSIPMLADRGAVVSWDRLVDAARRDGADLMRLLRRLDEIVADAYPADVADVVRTRLPGLL